MPVSRFCLGLVEPAAVSYSYLCFCEIKIWISISISKIF